MIRVARPDEAALLTRLAHRSKAFWGYAQADMQRWAGDLRFDAASIRHQPTYVVEEAGTVCAVIQLCVDDAPWEIGGLWVAPRSMRRGHARALVQHVVAMAGNCGQTTLAIDADPHALAFYCSVGARQVGEIHAPIVGLPDRMRPQLRLDFDDFSPRGGGGHDA